MSIRISGGVLKGRLIESPSGMQVRPTGARLRESFFSIVQSRLHHCEFWDLYSGSGIMGMEAYSRGASTVVFVEKDPKNITRIRKESINLAIDSAAFIRKPVAHFITDACKQGIQAHIIYADPPFTEEYPDLREALDCLHVRGIAAFEFPARTPPAWMAEASEIRNYGESSLALFYKKENTEKKKD
jgi:16S rRNA (guanine966-N2)-methyltransferase